MRNFFGHGMTAWRQLRDSLHVYALPDERLRAAVAPYQAVIARFDACAGQPPAFLHATVQRLPWFRPDLPAERLRDLSAGLADRLRHHGRFEVPLGPPVVGDHGVSVGAAATGAWTALVETVRALAVETLGPIPELPGPPRGPHVSLGYGVGDGDSAALQASLDAVPGPGPLVLRVDAAHLLSVHQDPVAGVFTWDKIGTHPFGRTRTPVM